eukprot:6650639-Prymnesium_polylepis.1
MLGAVTARVPSRSFGPKRVVSEATPPRRPGKRMGRCSTPRASTGSTISTATSTARARSKGGRRPPPPLAPPLDTLAPLARS